MAFSQAQGISLDAIKFHPVLSEAVTEPREVGAPPAAPKSLAETLKVFNAREWDLGRHVIFKPDPNGIDWPGWRLSTFCAWRGRAMIHILVPLAVVMANAMIISALSDPHIMGGYVLQIPESNSFEEGYKMLAVPVSLMLVFRLQRAAVRFYEARHAFGRVIESCRVLAGQAAQYLSHDPKNRDEFCRWTIVFAFACRNYLRGGGPDAREDLAGLLTVEDAERLNQAKMQPLMCMDRIRAAAWAGLRSNESLQPAMAAQPLIGIEATLATITGAISAMERINNTPLPIAWVAHLRQCLVFYLLGLPLFLVPSWAWASPVITCLISVTMLGLESAAVACERPFGLNTNHLPMTAFCKTISENVQQILAETAHLQAVADLEGGGLE